MNSTLDPVFVAYYKWLEAEQGAVGMKPLIISLVYIDAAGLLWLLNFTLAVVFVAKN